MAKYGSLFKLSEKKYKKIEAIKPVVTISLVMKEYDELKEIIFQRTEEELEMIKSIVDNELKKLFVYNITSKKIKNKEGRFLTPEEIAKNLMMVIFTIEGLVRRQKFHLNHPDTFEQAFATALGYNEHKNHPIGEHLADELRKKFIAFLNKEFEIMNIAKLCTKIKNSSLIIIDYINSITDPNNMRQKKDLVSEEEFQKLREENEELCEKAIKLNEEEMANASDLDDKIENLSEMFDIDKLIKETTTKAFQKAKQKREDRRNFRTTRASI
ncbi:MAG: hypothetical protein CMH64_03255 [Nanoarchaeota archaeon]|nr:hypothetical protein [Nanoarchaeota archaeon]|tara:strand:- start:246 stop:1055 length:810 start_codon:yes stop_codon:yes gene_type:complete